jgi:hypothetical protein
MHFFIPSPHNKVQAFAGTGVVRKMILPKLPVAETGLKMPQ